MTGTALVRGRAMGCRVEVQVVGGPDPGSAAAEGLAQLGAMEARWSRFIPSSDIGRINARTDDTVEVHSGTRDLLLLALHGWKVTDGRFDPTVLGLMVQHGYDRSFGSLRPGQAGSVHTAAAPLGAGQIRVDVERCTVTLPPGVGLDLGGIGKGWAADVVAATTLAAGALGVMVNVGGDVRVSGRPPSGDAWTIAVEDPFDTTADIEHLTISDGAVVVSSRLTRTWAGPQGRTVHHLMDPRSGAPVTTGLASAAVVAGTAWWGEVLTKAVMTDGAIDGLALLERIGDGSQGFVVTDDGAVHRSCGLPPFIARSRVGAAR